MAGAALGILIFGGCAGTHLGLGVTVRPSRVDEPAPFEATPPGSGWFSLFETHRLQQVLLEQPGPN